MNPVHIAYGVKKSNVRPLLSYHEMSNLKNNHHVHKVRVKLLGQQFILTLTAKFSKTNYFNIQQEYRFTSGYTSDYCYTLVDILDLCGLCTFYDNNEPDHIVLTMQKKFGFNDCIRQLIRTTLVSSHVPVEFKKDPILLGTFYIADLQQRFIRHDDSKTSVAEQLLLDGEPLRLKDTAYASSEYFNAIQRYQNELNAHYASNDHHPEHYDGGITHMPILPLIEMLIDWYASTERTNNGNIVTSIENNQARFNYSDNLKQILLNTIQQIFLDNA